MNIRKDRDNTPFRTHRAGGGIGIKPLGAWIAGIALAALVVSAPALFGAVIDDFDGDQPGWDGWNPPTAPSDPPAWAERVSKRLRIAAHFTTPTDPANLFPHLCNVYYRRDLPVRQGQTLELRTDVVSLTSDNLFALLVTMDTKGGEYVLMRDRNEVALLKWSQTDGLSVAFWETTSITYQVCVLALTLTPEGDDLLVETTVIAKADGHVLFHRTVRDTPASDWGVPDPLPHGWHIFGPDVGPPYTEDLKVVGLGMAHDTDGQQGSAAVYFDTFESRTGAAATLDIEKTVTVGWPEDTFDEMIVAGADSIDSSVWTPYPAPITRQFGHLCIAVPATKAEQYFKLVRGTYFIDDFSEAKQPFATRQEYRLFWQDAEERVTVGNGVMQVSRTGAAHAGVLIVPPEDVLVRDFYTSVDILSLTTSSSNWMSIVVTARGRFTNPEQTAGDGCIAGLVLNHNSLRGHVQTAISTSSGDVLGVNFSIEDRPPPYRLEWSGVGQSLRLRVLSLVTEEIIAEQALTHTLVTEGFVALYVRGPSNEPTTHEVILDNYFVTGTKH